MKQLVTAALLLTLWVALPSCKTDGRSTSPHNPTGLPLEKIHLPEGFRISIFANVHNARSMTLGDKGTVFVGEIDSDKVFALTDSDHDGYAEKKYVVASGLTMPNGVAFHNGSLYIAEYNKVWRIDNIEDKLANPGPLVLVSNNFPSDKTHGWKYIAFGPDNKLYVPVGAPCNICDSAVYDPRFASITRMNADGSDFEVFAHGIRNTVGFDWHPVTKELWFTDNGRDLLGDNLPPDELNRAPQAGMNFGYPYCHGGDIKDPDFGAQHLCDEFTPPVLKLGPHVASLGAKFYTGSMFPAQYKNQLFIAEHGSWNRSTPIGYRVMLVKLNGNTPISYETFADGWLQNGAAWGRPVALLQLKDGSLLISDDKANVIYRITYQGVK